jgi:hypothetical protein
MASGADPRSGLLDALKGIGVSLIAAYGFSLLFLLFGTPRAIENWQSWRVAGVFGMPLVAVGAFSWFVIPIGALVGFLLPRLVRGRQRLTAALIGSLVSVGIALLWGVSFALVITVTRRSGSSVRWQEVHGVVRWIFPLLTLYSMPWVMAFACRRSLRGVA